MARILIHSNAPFNPSGYGQQVALLAPRLGAAGHEVAVSAFTGIAGTRIQWQGIPVYPGGMNPYGADVIAGHAKDFKADLVLTLMDIWGLGQQGWDALASVNAAAWMPIDCDPLSVLDREALAASKARPIAMSQFGRQQLGLAGFNPLMVPHGVDAQVFAPQDKDACRDLLGIPREAFVVGINAANADPPSPGGGGRKAFPEQFAAFAILRNRHSDSLLLVHTFPYGPGMDLHRLAARLGIEHSVRFSNPYKYATGGYSAADMAAWYGCLDVYSGATKAEGFGLPVLEAQACGVPVVVTDCSALSELCGAGWAVDAEPDWNDGHLSWWAKPHVTGIANAYERAYGGAWASPQNGKARTFALGYDADALMPQWKTIVDALV